MYLALKLSQYKWKLGFSTGLGQTPQVRNTVVGNLGRLESDVIKGLTVFSFPEAHRKRIRTINGLERLNREILRRTKVDSIFRYEASCLRLISAILVETSDEWESGKTYLQMNS